jgi:hypothetical protein
MSILQFFHSAIRSIVQNLICQNKFKFDVPNSNRAVRFCCGSHPLPVQVIIYPPPPTTARGRGDLGAGRTQRTLADNKATIGVLITQVSTSCSASALLYSQRTRACVQDPHPTKILTHGCYTYDLDRPWSECSCIWSSPFLMYRSHSAMVSMPLSHLTVSAALQQQTTNRRSHRRRSY